MEQKAIVALDKGTQSKSHIHLSSHSGSLADAFPFIFFSHVIFTFADFDCPRAFSP